MKNYISLLKEYADLKLRSVDYDELPKTIDGYFCCKCTYDGNSHIGKGLKKKEAKLKAAEGLYIKLKGVSIEETFFTGCNDVCVKMTPSNSIVNEDELAQGNPIGELQEYCAQYSFRTPQYTFVSEVGEAHNKVFTVRCTVGSVSSENKGPTKKFAKRLSAQHVLSLIKANHDDSSVLSSKIERTVDINSAELMNSIVAKLAENDFIKQLDRKAIGKKLTISEQSFIFLNGHYPKSDAVQKVASCTDLHAEFGCEKDPISFVDVMFKELNMRHSYSKIPGSSCLICLYVKCPSGSMNHGTCPEWSFLAQGDTMEIAKRKAALSWMEFVKKMTGPSYKCQSIPK